MISLTSLTLIADEAMAPNELRMHPDLIVRVRRAFLEADLLRSAHPTTRVRVLIHPLTSVGDEDDAA